MPLDIVVDARKAGFHPVKFAVATNQVHLLSWDELNEGELLLHGIHPVDSLGGEVLALVITELERRIDKYISKPITVETIKNSMLLKDDFSYNPASAHLRKKVLLAIDRVLRVALERAEMLEELADLFVPLDSSVVVERQRKFQERLKRDLKNRKQSGDIAISQRMANWIWGSLGDETREEWNAYVSKRLEEVSDFSTLLSYKEANCCIAETKTLWIKRLIATGNALQLSSPEIQELLRIYHLEDMYVERLADMALSFDDLAGLTYSQSILMLASEKARTVVVKKKLALATTPEHIGHIRNEHGTQYISEAEMMTKLLEIQHTSVE